MHNTLKKALCAMIFFIFSSFGQQTAEKALEQKLGGAEDVRLDALKNLIEEELKKNPPNQKRLMELMDEYINLDSRLFKQRKAKSVTEKVPADDPSLSPKEKEQKLLARQLELQEELKKLEEKKRKLETPSERKARKMIEKREKQEQRAEEFRNEMKSLANVSGCPPDSVVIGYQAENYTRWGVGVAVDVKNPSAYPVNISRPRYGDIVRNLCPGGKMTLYFKFQGSEGNSVSFPLTATAISPDGVMMESSFWISMNRMSAPNRTMEEVFWTINLNRVYQAR